MHNGWKTTHINIYARVGENSGVRGVGWDVSVEFLTIPVPAIRVCQKTVLNIILRSDSHHLTLYSLSPSMS